ncbi:tape measure protein [Arthrobacter phage BlueFeather]|uniref:Tape measure protein n=1 Tax=Arthrobacter phage BlueFeather TaxID=2713258 RepID=A0A6G8R2A0_9CAUD|nr:tape measure protein [Arthrobacter phage BlueFeather]QIN94314.1 tape measure protein [Arthrobacter phage BlueFeather]
MAGGIKIPFLADVAKFIKGTDSMADALEEVSDSLEDLGKNKALDKVEDGLQDAGKEAERLEAKVKDAFDTIGKEARDAGSKTAKSVKDGTDKAGEGFGELKDEAAGTAREAAASFGSIEDAAGALQEVAANAFAGFGPAGMAAGVVAAAGIGLGISALTDHADKVNENKDKMLALAQTIRDNGGALSMTDHIAAMDEYGFAIQDSKEWFEIWQTDAVTGFDKIQKIAQDTGITVKDIFKGGFGDRREAELTLKVVTSRLEDLRAKKDAVFNMDGAVLDKVDGATLTSLEDAEELIRDNIRAQEAAEEAERLRKEAIAGTTEALKEDNEAKEEAADRERDLRSYIDGTAEAARRSAEAKEEAAEEEADLAKYVAGTTENLRANIDALREQTDATRDSITTDLDYRDGVDALNVKLTENGLTTDINTAKGRENQRAILDQAQVIQDLAVASLDAGGKTDVVTAKFNAQKDALITQVTPAFGGSREAARLYIEQVLKTPPTAKTKVELTGEEAVKTKLNNLATPITVPLRPGVEPSYLDRAIASMSGISIPVSLTPRAGRPLP